MSTSRATCHGKHMSYGILSLLCPQVAGRGSARLEEWGLPWLTLEPCTTTPKAPTNAIATASSCEAEAWY